MAGRGLLCAQARTPVALCPHPGSSPARLPLKVAASGALATFLFAWGLGGCFQPFLEVGLENKCPLSGRSAVTAQAGFLSPWDGARRSLLARSSLACAGGRSPGEDSQAGCLMPPPSPNGVPAGRPGLPLRGDVHPSPSRASTPRSSGGVSRCAWTLPMVSASLSEG